MQSALDLESATGPREVARLLEPLQTSRISRFTLIFWALILIQLVPLWSAKYFPSQDGPAHLENAQLLLQWFRGDAGAWRSYYFINPKPVPNWLGHLALAGLMTLASPLIAEKILLSGYVIALALGMRYALNAMPARGRNPKVLSLVVLPLTYSSVLHLGFYNFSIGIAVYLFTVGFWIRHRESLRGRVLPLALLMILTYFTHVFALLAVWMTLATLAAALTIGDIAQMKRGRLSRAQLREGFRSRALLALLACLPALILLGATTMWELQRPTQMSDLASNSDPTLPDPRPQAKRIAPIATTPLGVLRDMPEMLVSFAPIERWPARTYFAALALALGWLIGLKLRRRGWRLSRQTVGGAWETWNAWDALLLLLLFFVTQAIVASDHRSRELFIRPRAELFAAVIFILWLGTQELSRALRPVLAGVAAAMAIVSTSIHLTQYRALSAELDDYLAMGRVIHPDATVLPVFVDAGWRSAASGQVAIHAGIFAHAAGYLVAERGVIDLQNYEANTNHFPVLFRPERNPCQILGNGIQRQPPCANLSNMNTSAAAIDDVLVWGDLEGAAKVDPCAADFQRQLRGWTLIYTTPSGFGTVWEKQKIKS